MLTASNAKCSTIESSADFCGVGMVYNSASAHSEVRYGHLLQGQAGRRGGVLHVFRAVYAVCQLAARWRRRNIAFSVTAAAVASTAVAPASVAAAAVAAAAAPHHITHATASAKTPTTLPPPN